MKSNFIFLILSLLLIGAIGCSKNHKKIHNTIQKMHWNGQSSWRIESGDKNIYIDPLQLPEGSPKADMIFVTHSHGDHLSIRDIETITGENTILVGPKSCEEKLNLTGIKNIKLINPNDDFTIKGIQVKAVPAYNVVKTQFHPKENKWVGYILEIDGVKIYHSGDTERIQEMKNIDCDIAILPLGQTYTMQSVEEAVQAILDINPVIAIPMHYGMYEGTTEDAEKFKELLKDKVEVIIKENE